MGKVRKEKLSKSRKKDLMDEILSHFHPESLGYGGWTITIRDISDIAYDFLIKEFEGTLYFTREGSTSVKVSESPYPFSHKHTILVLRQQAEMFREEADRLYKGLKKLVED